jgi:hypothetical protein
MLDGVGCGLLAAAAVACGSPLRLDHNRRPTHRRHRAGRRVNIAASAHREHSALIGTRGLQTSFISWRRKDMPCSSRFSIANW